MKKLLKGLINLQKGTSIQQGIGFFLTSVILVVGLQLTAFGKSPLHIEEANQAGILMVGVGPDPECLDPQLVTGVVEQNILRALFEGLVTPDPKTLNPLPGVAEKWSVSQDGKRYTLYLRKNAQWSNGDSLSAGDFLFSFKRLFNAQLGSPSASSLFIIKNARAFYEKKAPFESVGIKAIDSHTLEIELDQPIPYFLSLLMLPACYPLHERTLQAYNSIETRNNTWTKPENMVCNGPFRLKQWKVGQIIGAEKNPYYWNAPLVALNEIHFKPITDVATEERAFRNGQLHITENVPYAKLIAYAKENNPDLRVHPYLGTYYYLLNVHTYPLNDLRVRRALSMAIDRESLAGSDQLKVKHRSAYNLIPNGCGGFTSKNYIQESIPEAQRLLGEAGFPNGKGFPKLKLIFNTAEGQTYVASAIQEMWKRNLNIEVELVNQEWKVYLSRRRTRDFDIARGGWIGDYNDPTTFLDLWVSNGNNNFVGWKNEKFDGLMNKAAETTDTQQRIAFFQEAEKILLEEMPLIPLHSSTTSHLVHKSVKNWQGNLLDWHLYQYIELDSKR